MSSVKIVVMGHGYVNLPLTHVFSKKYKVVEFDTKTKSIEELSRGYDKTLELDKRQRKEVSDQGTEFTEKLDNIREYR